MDKQQTPSKKRQLANVLIVAAVIAVIPFLLLFVSGRIQHIDVSSTFESIWNDIFKPDSAYNFIYEAPVLAIQLIAITIGVSLLFRVGGISQNTLDILSEKWYWKLFLFKYIIVPRNKKQVWHIYAGYFVLLLSLSPSMALYMADTESFEKMIRANYNISDEVEIESSFKLYIAMITSIPMLSMILLFTRVLSRIDLKILDTNIGVFVIAVFVSEAILIVAAGNNPLSVLDNIANPVNTESNARGGLEMYGFIFVIAAIVTVLDWFVAERIIRWFENRMKKLA